jgi:hypothetical protein
MSFFPPKTFTLPWSQSESTARLADPGSPGRAPPRVRSPAPLSS